MSFWESLGLLVSGGILTLGSSQITSTIAARRARSQRTIERAEALEESQRLVAMDRGLTALEALEVVDAVTNGPTPTSEDGYDYDLDRAAVDALRRAVLLLPHASARSALSHGLNLLDGWHTLTTWGPSTFDSLPYEHQRLTMRKMRLVLGACARGDASLPDEPVSWLETTGHALDVAWEARMEDEREFQQQYLESRKRGDDDHRADPSA